MLAEELATQGGCKFRSGIRPSVHRRRERRRVLDDDGDFGVVKAELGAIVQICRPANHDAVVGNKDLYMMSDLGQVTWDADRPLSERRAPH